MRLAVDAGGTFTDLMVEDQDGRVRSFKTPSRPDDPAQAVLDVIAEAAAGLGTAVPDLLDACESLVLGTTIGTNALLTGRTARTALFTTEGHPDILVFREAGREGLPIFDHTLPYPEPFVPRALTFEVPERVAHDGRIVRPLDEAKVLADLDRAAALGVEAIGVCLLWSFANPRHERRVGDLIAERMPAVPVTLSHELNPTPREYRRASSTCIDVALKPLMERFLGGLEEHLRTLGLHGPLLVSTSQGSLMGAADVAGAPIHAVMSGPAMAPVAGRAYGAAEGVAGTVIVTDTGGTSFDVTLVRSGRIPHTQETWIGRPYLGHMTGFPSVRIHSAAAGGGTIAWVDEAGLLCFGPASAGADPGPACFGRGGRRPTLTDACVVLGYIDPAGFLGGRLTLDADAARTALAEEVAGPLALSVEDAALAIHRVATEAMADAAEAVTAEWGADPRSSVIIAGGGAAGLNAVALARRMGCPRIVIPDAAPTLSAAGGLVGELSSNFATVGVTSSTAFDTGTALACIAKLSSRARAFIAMLNRAEAEATLAFAVDARYADQAWDIEVPLPETRLDHVSAIEALVDAVHATHEDLFAFRDPDAEIEFITWKVRVACRTGSGHLGRLGPAEAKVQAPRLRKILFHQHGAVDAAVLSIGGLASDVPVQGPAVIESDQTSIVLDPGASAWLTSRGSLEIRASAHIASARRGLAGRSL